MESANQSSTAQRNRASRAAQGNGGSVTVKASPVNAAPAAGAGSEAARQLVRIAREVLTLDELVDAIRRIYIFDALEACDYNYSKTAAIVGRHKNSLTRIMCELGIYEECERLKKKRGAGKRKV